MCNIQKFIKRYDYKFFDLYSHRLDSLEDYTEYINHLRYIKARCKCSYPNHFKMDEWI